MGSSSSESTSTTTNTTHNIALEDIEGGAIVGEGNTVTLTDHGAMAAAEEIAGTAHDALQEVGEASIEKMAVVSSDALGTVEQVAGDALDSNQSVSESAFLSMQSVTQQAMNAAEQNQNNLVRISTENTEALANMKKSMESGGATDLTDTMKTGFISMGAVAALLGVAIIIKGKGGK